MYTPRTGLPSFFDLFFSKHIQGSPAKCPSRSPATSTTAEDDLPYRTRGSRSSACATSARFSASPSSSTTQSTASRSEARRRGSRKVRRGASRRRRAPGRPHARLRPVERGGDVPVRGRGAALTCPAPRWRPRPEPDATLCSLLWSYLLDRAPRHPGAGSRPGHRQTGGQRVEREGTARDSSCWCAVAMPGWASRSAARAATLPSSCTRAVSRDCQICGVPWPSGGRRACQASSGPWVPRHKSWVTTGVADTAQRPQSIPLEAMKGKLPRDCDSLFEAGTASDDTMHLIREWMKCCQSKEHFLCKLETTERP